tara:strand:+ start:2041 stop:2613 length:573 start_codon:yes stop_codon:yes gene_type:complete
MNVEMEVDKSQMAKLQAALALTGKKKLNREMAIAINKTAQWTRKQTAKNITRGLRLASAVVKKRISQTKRAKPTSLSGQVTVNGTGRLSLKWFAYQQTSKGVPYKIEKGGTRKVAVGAFRGPKPGVQSVKLKNAIWKRAGKNRYPLKRLHGVSIVPYYKEHKLDGVTKKETAERLRYEVQRRIGQALRGF